MYSIAVLEDEELERNALCVILQNNISESNIIRPLRSGKEAINLIDTTPIDIMLVDINVPKPNGLEVLKHLRKVQSHTKVIIITAYDYFEMAHSAIQLKVHDYLLKPVRKEQLLDSVKACFLQMEAVRQNNELFDNIKHCINTGARKEALRLINQHIQRIITQEPDALKTFAHIYAAKLEEESEKYNWSKWVYIIQLRNDLYTLSQRQDAHERIANHLVKMTELVFQSTEEQSDFSQRMHRALEYIKNNLSHVVDVPPLIGPV